MAESIGAIACGLILVLASMLAGGVIYVVIRDVIKRNIRQKD